MPLPASGFGTHRAPGAVNNPWDDLQGSVSEGNAVSALTSEDFRDTSFRMLFMRHDQDDSLHFSYQLPHSWQPGSTVNPHLHVVPMADPPSVLNVRFAGEYVWVNVTGTIPAAASWTPFTADFSVSPGDAFKHKVAGLGSITPTAGVMESSVLLMRVYRNGTGLQDTYTTSKVGGTAAANLGVLSADVHIEKEKPGTATEYPTGS